jgi:hypothetical protein
MRQTLGIAVFSGMLGVTAFGIFFTPVFYSVIRKFTKRKAAAAPMDATKSEAAISANGRKADVASDGHATKSDSVPQPVH